MLLGFLDERARFLINKAHFAVQKMYRNKKHFDPSDKEIGGPAAVAQLGLGSEIAAQL
jgi:hypothetical protein